jgi:hypothetical protein
MVMGKNAKDEEHFVPRQQVHTLPYPHLVRNSELLHAASLEESEICHSVFHYTALNG